MGGDTVAVYLCEGIAVEVVSVGFGFVQRIRHGELVAETVVGVLGDGVAGVGTGNAVQTCNGKRREQARVHPQDVAARIVIILGDVFYSAVIVGRYLEQAATAVVGVVVLSRVCRDGTPGFER